MNLNFKTIEVHLFFFIETNEVYTIQIFKHMSQFL